MPTAIDPCSEETLLDKCPKMKCWEVDFKSVDINLNTLTNGKVVEKEYYGEQRLVWEGSQFLDKMIHFGNENLRVQYDSGRIGGEDYARAYSELVKNVLTSGVQLLVESAKVKIEAMKAYKQSEILEFQKQKEAHEIIKTKFLAEKIREEIRVLERQRIGFDDNILLKVFQAQLDAYAMIFSSGMNDAPLAKVFSDNELQDVYDIIKYKGLNRSLPENLDYPSSGGYKNEKEYKIDKRVCPNESKIKV